MVKKAYPYFIILIVFLFIGALLFFIQEFTKEVKNESSYFLSVTALAGIIGLIGGLWYKRYGLESLVKTIIPSAISLAGTLWLLSSGYLNLRAENLRYEIIEFESIRDSIASLNEMLMKKNSSLENDKTDIINQLNIAKQTYEELKVINSDKNKLIDEQERLITLYKSRVSVSNKPILEIVSIDVTNTLRNLKVKVYDKNGIILTNKDIQIIQDETPSIATYNQKSKDFTIQFPLSQALENNYTSESLKNLYWIGITEAGYLIQTGREFKPRYFTSVKLPMINAKYNIILNDYEK